MEVDVYLVDIGPNAAAVHTHEPSFSEGLELIWLPLSQIEGLEDAEVNTELTLTMPEWLATDKGLI